MMDAAGVLRELRRCLANLAADANGQVLYLRSLGPVSVDELALELGEALDTTWIPVEAGAITSSQLQPAQRVREILKEMSGPKYEDLWTEEGLAKSGRWEAVRQAAKEALGTLPA